MTNPAIRVRGLQKRYGTTVAVSDVSFEVAAGEIFGLLGPNGAGKTTTIECLLGLRVPDAGLLEVDGIDVQEAPAAARQRIGAALQSTALPEKMTPREALTLFGAFYPRRIPAVALLQRFTLTDKADAAFDRLSGGQQQRLALALAFVNDPKVVVLDEPTAGLDVRARREFQDLVRAVRGTGVTVLLATHDLHEAEMLCDRVAVIARGTTVAIGAPRDLGKREAVPRIYLRATAPFELAHLEALPGLLDVTADDCSARLHTTDVDGTIDAVLRELRRRDEQIVELRVETPTLEDVFLELTRSEPRA
jgi:ABC-2 type transport system ATP-binding protein